MLHSIYNNIEQIAYYWQNIIENEPIYGFGGSAIKSYDDLFPFLPFTKQLEAIFVNDEYMQTASHNEIPILSSQNLKNRKRKVIVLITSWHQLNIKNQLETYGMKEYRDYIAWFELIPLLHWHINKSLFINTIDMPITTRCSLRCKHCSLFMPLYKDPQHIGIKELICDMDLFFSRIDYCSYFNILGGEPLLHPHLKEYLLHIKKNYIKRIKTIRIITNATTPLKPDLIRVCKDLNVIFRVSDYSMSTPQIRGLQRTFIAELQKNKLNYIVSSTSKWQNLYTEDGLVNLSNSEISEHYKRCGAPFKGYQSGIFYPCYIQWSADLVGIHKISDSDIVELNSDNAREQIFKYQMNAIADNHYLSLCRNCYGLDPIYYMPIPAGEQI